MYRLERYFQLMQESPHLFVNDPSPLSLQIVTDKNVLFEQQKVLYEMGKKRGNPEIWMEIGVLSEDEWALVLRDLVRFPDGKYGRYIRMMNKVSDVEGKGHDVVVLTIHQENIILIRHFRHEKRKWFWECPRGFGEPGLTPEENARKEIQEELGLTMRDIRIIGGCLPGGELDKLVFLLAEAEGEVAIEKEEGIDMCRHVLPSEFRAMIRSGEITDSFTLQAYAYAMAQGCF